jgi:hypothetical protein
MLKTIPLTRRDRRQSLRQTIFLNELSALVSGERFEARFNVVDISPYGLGLVAIEPGVMVALNEKDKVTVELQLREQKIGLNATITSFNQVKWRGKTLQRVGVSFDKDRSKAEANINQRCVARYELNSLNTLTVTARHLIHMYQLIYFSVVNLSSSGLSLKTPVANKLFIAGCRLAAEIHIPGYGTFKQTLVVRHVREDPAERCYLLGCSYQNPSEGLLRALADYSLMFAVGTSFRELKRNGFLLRFDSESISVYSSTDPEELDEILELRRHAYGQAGTFALRETDPIEKFTDSFDQHSRHIVARAGSKTVGAVRVIFNDGDPAKSDILQKGYTLPEAVMRGGFTEISKMSTDAEFRDGSLLMRLGMEAVRISILEGVGHIAVIARDYMVPTYRRLGFEPAGQCLMFNGQEYNLLIADIAKLISGASISFITWIFVGAPLINDLYERRQRSFSMATLIKARLGVKVRPLVETLLAKRKRKLTKVVGT